MGTLTHQPINYGEKPANTFAKNYYNYSIRTLSPSPMRRKLFPESSGPRSLSSPFATPIREEENSSSYSKYSSLPPAYPPLFADGFPSRKLSTEDTAPSSRRSSRAPSPFDDYSIASRRSSRASSPFNEDARRSRRSDSRRLSRGSSRGVSPFEVDVPPGDAYRRKGTMQNFMDSLRSRTPSPSTRSTTSSPTRRSSSLLSDSSPYGTLPRTSKRSTSPSNRTQTLRSELSLTLSPPGSSKGGVDISTPSPSSGLNGNRVDKAVALLRQLSEDWSINTEKEEGENKLDQLDNSVSFYKTFKRNVKHASRRNNSANASANRKQQPPAENSYRPLSLSREEDPLLIASQLIEYANRRSPSPPKSLGRQFSVSPDRRGSHTRDQSNGEVSSSNQFIPGYSSFTSPEPQNSTSPGNNGPQSAPARLDEKQKYFLPFTFPDQFPYKIPTGMPATQNGSVSPAASPNPRRFSEEGNFRRPLATLHEDEVMSRRRFSEAIGTKNYYDTSEVADELYRHQRKLSEAGVRKISGYLCGFFQASNLQLSEQRTRKAYI